MAWSMMLMYDETLRPAPVTGPTQSETRPGKKTRMKKVEPLALKIQNRKRPRREPGNRSVGRGAGAPRRCP